MTTFLIALAAFWAGFIVAAILAMARRSDDEMARWINDGCPRPQL